MGFEYYFRSIILRVPEEACGFITVRAFSHNTILADVIVDLVSLKDREFGV